MKAYLRLLSYTVIVLVSSCGLQKSSTVGETSQTSSSSTERLNVPANSCEIYIDKLMTAPSSHGSASLVAIAKVPWLGNGEMIQQVGFYGCPVAKNLGTPPECHWGPSYDEATPRIYPPVNGSYLTSRGEYEFRFPVRSGTVLSQCAGYEYAWIGSIFVETNFKTYWLNHNMDPSQDFYFDSNGYRNIERFGSTYNAVSTRRSELTYYNPRSCTR